MKRIFTAICLLLCVIFCGCEEQINSGPYFSIALTEYKNGIDTDGGMVTNVYAYDINREISKRVGDFDYNAQYPLGVYSREDNCIYYSSTVYEDGKGKGDQLFSINLATKDIKQLTDCLFAINYIVPTKEKIIMVAVEKGKRPLRLYYYDKRSCKLTEVFFENDPTENMNVNFLSYNPCTKQLIASTFFEAEDYKAVTDANEGKTSKYIPSDHYIFDFTEDINNPKEIYRTKNMYIQRLAACDETIFFTQSDTLRDLGGQYESYTFNKNNPLQSVVQVTNIDKMMYVNQFAAFAYNDNEIYFMGLNEDNEEEYPRGVYKYNFLTSQIEHIFSSDLGFMNNFVLLS